MSCVLLWLTEPALSAGRTPLCFALSGGARAGSQPGARLLPPDRFHAIPEARAAGRRSRRGAETAGCAPSVMVGRSGERRALRHNAVVATATAAALSAFSYFLCAKSVSDHLVLAARWRPGSGHLVIQERAVGVAGAAADRARVRPVRPCSSGVIMIALSV